MNTCDSLKTGLGHGFSSEPWNRLIYSSTVILESHTNVPDRNGRISQDIYQVSSLDLFELDHRSTVAIMHFAAARVLF